MKLEGIFHKDRQGWPSYAMIGDSYTRSWIDDAVTALPDGAYVRLTIEVLDDDPERSKLDEKG